MNEPSPHRPLRRTFPPYHLFRPYQQWPELHAFLDYYVELGQRGPTAVMVACSMPWPSLRQHARRPLLVLGSSLLCSM
ncbi:hypothetical protein SMICM304S_08818 [Streptomyces microflavus]